MTYLAPCEETTPAIRSMMLSSRCCSPASGAVGDEAREVRGPGLPRTAWHLLRPGIDGIVRVRVIDQRDPVDEWIFSTRTPDRVIAAIRRSQRA